MTPELSALLKGWVPHVENEYHIRACQYIGELRRIEGKYIQFPKPFSKPDADKMRSLESQIKWCLEEGAKLIK